MSITQRFKTLLYKLDFNASQLADELNVAKSTVTKSINGDTLPSSKILIPLGEKLNISIDWLLFGKGEMFLEGESSNVNKIDSSSSRNSTYADIKLLNDKVVLLEQSVKDKEKLISMLERNQR
jgi:transcriptional regulator with XRE-family HTH domain